MILMLAAALLADPFMTLPVSDPHARWLIDACVAAATRTVSDGPPRSVFPQEMRVRREPAGWRIDYAVTLEDRNGRSQAWTGACTIAAPRVVVIANR